MDPFKLITESNIIAWRRHLHQHPELSFQEVNTSQYIYEVLEKFQVYELERLTPTSVVATLKGAHPGKTIALRADIDALPITEETDVAFHSVNEGVMHACGHDAHTAMLLGAAEGIATLKDQLHGTVKLIFQHAEELLPGGAKELVAANVMEGVDYVFGIHVNPMLPTGAVGYRVGLTHASPDTFALTIQGKGAHAARPHVSIDPIVVGLEIGNALHHIVSRNIDPFDPAVVTIGEFTSGKAANVIPDTAFIQGTVRTVEPSTRKFIEDKIKATVDQITKMHGASYELEYITGYDPVINDAACVEIVTNAARKILTDEMILEQPAGMGGEDFSAYMTKAPGAFYYIGVGNEVDKGYGISVHHPKFKIDEAGLKNGAAMHVQLVIDLLIESV